MNVVKIIVTMIVKRVVLVVNVLVDSDNNSNYITNVIEVDTDNDFNISLLAIG